MARFYYNSFAYYSQSGEHMANAVVSSFLTDSQDGDDEFSDSETLTSDFDGSYSYVGTTIIDGFTYVVGTGAGNRFYLFGSIEDIEWGVRFPFTLPPVDPAPFTVCFLPGTLIATPDGEVAVEL